MHLHRHNPLLMKDYYFISYSNNVESNDIKDPHSIEVKHRAMLIKSDPLILAKSTTPRSTQGTAHNMVDLAKMRKFASRGQRGHSSTHEKTKAHEHLNMLMVFLKHKKEVISRLLHSSGAWGKLCFQSPSRAICEVGKKEDANRGFALRSWERKETHLKDTNNPQRAATVDGAPVLIYIWSM